LMDREFGQWREWNHDMSLDWHLLADAPHAGLQRWVQDLNRLYCHTPALAEGDCDPAGFAWIDCNDATYSVLCFLRQGRTNVATVLVVCNFTPIPRFQYRVGAPCGAFVPPIPNHHAPPHPPPGFSN